MKIVRVSNIDEKHAPHAATRLVRRKKNFLRHGKTFDQLSNKEKDELLKDLAIGAGLIKSDTE